MNHLYVPVGATGELFQRSDLGDLSPTNHPFSRPGRDEEKRISIWDVDGTITSDWVNETTGIVYEWMCNNSYTSINSESHRNIQRLKAELLENPTDGNRRAYYTAINIASDRMMKLLTPDELQLIARKALVDAPIHDTVRPEINRMHELEIPILLASGTPGPLLHGIADEIGAHYIMGTHFPLVNGRYDPYGETISRGKDKDIYIPKLLGEMSLRTLNFDDIERLGSDFGYDELPEAARITVTLGAGNTAHDQGILDLAAEKLVVDGDEALLQYAKDHGARVITTDNSARTRLISVA